MAAIDAGLAATLAAARSRRRISDVISTDAYLAARAAAADDGRRAIALVPGARRRRLGIRPGAIGMLGFSAGAFLAVDVALDPRAEQVAFIAPIYGGETQGAPVPADAPPLFTAVAQDDILVRIVEGVHADWAAADRPSSCTPSPGAPTGSAWCSRACRRTAGPTCSLAWLDDLGARMTTFDTVRVAAVQATPVILDADATIEKMVELARLGGGAGRPARRLPRVLRVDLPDRPLGRFGHRLVGRPGRALGAAVGVEHRRPGTGDRPAGRRLRRARHPRGLRRQRAGGRAAGLALQLPVRRRARRAPAAPPQAHADDARAPLPRRRCR